MDRFNVVEHTIPCQHIRGYYRSTATTQEEELCLAVKEYIPISNPEPTHGDVTIIAAHCAGMIKELYEPIFTDLIALSERSDSRFRIRAIWIADVVTHGQSSSLNEGKLGIDLSWDDHARDLLHMTNVLRDKMVRPIVGMGHSLGGTMITRLAAMHPRLFASLLLLEPAINKDYTPAMNYAPTYFHSFRRDVWSSREEAFEETKKGAQRYWDPQVLQKWYEYGFRETPTLEHPRDSAVTLATTKHHNARAYARGVYPKPGTALLDMNLDRRTHPDIAKDDLKTIKQPAYAPTSVAAYRDMPHLLPSVLFVYGDMISTAASRLDNRAEMIPITGTGSGGSGGVGRGKVKEVIISKSSHFLPFEKPRAVAEACNEWLQIQMPQWFEEEKLNELEWQSRGSAREKATLDEEWMWWARQTYSKKKSNTQKQSHL